MNIVWLVQYMSVLSILLAVVTSAITYLPGPKWQPLVLPILFTCTALGGFYFAGVLRRLPATHWVHHSAPLRIGLTVAATAITLMLFMCG